MAMRKNTKRSQKQNRFDKFASGRLGLILGLLIVVSISFAGAYYVGYSVAANEYCAHASLNGISPNTPIQAGSTYTNNYYIWGARCQAMYADDPELPLTVKWTAGIQNVQGGAPYQALSNISPMSGQYIISNVSNVSRNINIQYTTTNSCGGIIELTVRLFGKSGNQLASYTEAGGRYGEGCPGGSEPSPDPSPSPQPNTSPNPGNDGSGPGDDGDGSGGGNGSGGSGTTGAEGPKGTDGSGQNGGGGGGSSATKQSTAPNSVPQSSPQGNSDDQVAMEPSPFFDGKQYAPGSDESWDGEKTSAASAKEIVQSWPFVVSVVILLGAGMMVLRLWHRKLSLRSITHRRK